jgi:hypothetical protein
MEKRSQRPDRGWIRRLALIAFVVLAVALGRRDGLDAKTHAASSAIKAAASVKTDCRITTPAASTTQAVLSASAIEKPGTLPFIALATFNPVAASCTKGTSALLTVPTAASELTRAGGTQTLNIITWIASSSASGGTAKQSPDAGQFVTQSGVKTCPAIPSVPRVTSLSDTMLMTFGVASCMPAHQTSYGPLYTGQVNVTIAF